MTIIWSGWRQVKTNGLRDGLWKLPTLSSSVLDSRGPARVQVGWHTLLSTALDYATLTTGVLPRWIG